VLVDGHLELEAGVLVQVSVRCGGVRTKHRADLEHALKVGADGTLQVERRVAQERFI
jgi:hypothetical protein